MKKFLSILKKIKLWEVLSTTFVLLFIVFYVAYTVTGTYAGVINSQLGLNKRETDIDVEELAKNLENLGVEIEGEGAVLLKNEEALPLQGNEKLSCFFMGSTNFNYTASGSGGADSSTYKTLKEALEDEGFSINQTLWDFYTTGVGAETSRREGKVYGRKETLSGGKTLFKAREIPWDRYSDAEKTSFSEYNTAIFTVSRSSGEGKDISTTESDGHDGSYLSLTNEELSVLKEITALKKAGKVKKIIVLLNTSSQFQCDFLDNAQFCEEQGIDVDACLWVGNVGKSGMGAIGKLLKGEIIPSGRLSDTYLNDNFSSPAMASWMANDGWFSGTYTNAASLELNESQRKYAVYAEGIYVGYRYYETRYEDYVMGTGEAGDYDYKSDVAYPFGYGLSYTQFSYSDFSVTDNGNDTYTVNVTVTNDGDTYTGKEVVQVYLQKPYIQGGVEKASVELAGYAKTKPLAPHESEPVSITVEKYSFKSYDSDTAKTYILDEGDYYLTVAKNAHDAVNNILAKKGYTTQNTDGRMDKDGASEFVDVAWHNSAYDKTTYATSIYTGEQITNQFDFADVNLYDGSGDNGVTYVSRNDWTGTFPTEKVLLSVATEKMQKDLSSNKGITEDEDAQMPTFGAKNGLKLSDLYGKEYNDEDWDRLLDQMSFDDMANLLTGNYLTNQIDSISKPLTVEADGPTGDTTSVTKNSFPCEGIWASSYNNELLEKIGEYFAEDVIASGHTGIYAPGVNIHRVPFGGRSAEYFSEDGFLSGVCAAYEVKGIQSKGVIAHVKHFAFNDQDTDRAGISIWLNEQEAREIMLVPFEYALNASNEKTAVQRGNAHAVMTAFSRIGCEWAGACPNMLFNVLHGEWNFDGFNITDMASSNGAQFMTYMDGVMLGTDQFLRNPDYLYELDNYKSSATFCSRMRDSAHRMLYSVCNYSIAMNDELSSGMPWWQATLLSFEIIFAVVGFAAVALYIAGRLVSRFAQGDEGVPQAGEGKNVDASGFGLADKDSPRKKKDIDDKDKYR